MPKPEPTKETSVDFDATGIVFNIQRFSVHDGPGIRTIVFLKGCPMSCKWCANPESQNPNPELMFDDPKAAEQAAESKQTPLHIVKLAELGGVTDQDEDDWLRDGMILKGKRVTVSETMKQLEKDSKQYARSGGGITLSGGEPLMQPVFAAELLKACKERGWTTAIETAAYVHREVIAKVIPWVDTVLLDIKSPYSDVHEEWTGVPNKRILDNAILISNLAHTIIRIPTIPGVNNSPQSIEDTCRIAEHLHGVREIDILPYHTLGEGKYHMLSKDYPMGDTPPLPIEEAEELAKIVRAHGFDCVIGG